MSANSTQTAFLPAAWSEALDGIQHALDEAVAGAAEREQQLQTQTPGNELNAPAWQEHLKRLDEHLALMQASSQQPEKGASGSRRNPGSLRNSAKRMAGRQRRARAKAG